jgi:hypothetical protein
MEGVDNKVRGIKNIDPTHNIFSLSKTALFWNTLAVGRLIRDENQLRFALLNRDPTTGTNILHSFAL